MSLAGLLTDTCTITEADGTAVATAEPCRFQEQAARRQIIVLDGMQSDDQPAPRVSLVFGPAAALAEHYRISAVTHENGTMDARRFEVQTVIGARGGRGPAFQVAYCKVV